MKTFFGIALLFFPTLLCSQVPVNFSGADEILIVEKSYYNYVSKFPEKAGELLAGDWLYFDAELNRHPNRYQILKQKLQDLLETDFHYYCTFFSRLNIKPELRQRFIFDYLIEDQKEVGVRVLSFCNGKTDFGIIPSKGEGWSAFKQRIQNEDTTPTIVKTNPIKNTPPTVVKKTQQQVSNVTRSVGQEKITILMPWQTLKDVDEEKGYCTPRTIYTRNNSTNGQDVPIQGYYKAKLYQTPNSSYVQIKGSLELPGSLYDHRFTDRELYHIGIICSHSMYPTKTWLDVNPEKQCYTVTYVASKEGDGIKFQYTDYRKNKVVVKVKKISANSYGTNVEVNLDIN